MSTLTRDITTEPTDGGNLLKRWTVGDSRGSIVLTVLHMASEPLVHMSVPDGDGGHWMLCGFAAHESVAEPPAWGCPAHAGCDLDAIVGRISRPAWERIVAADLADDAVWAELEAMHAAWWPAGGEAA
ncbi:hypothetical protein [Rhizomonospora bruguierae]|uniref:hypothetical protein n=1 Tax=Rhizomonospora bruguierae TaxID=1581705 RepID=UPI001BCF6F6A|nr:hypothetical protein [Micromonospora sp. NBRC 107566]